MTKILINKDPVYPAGRPSHLCTRARHGSKSEASSMGFFCFFFKCIFSFLMNHRMSRSEPLTLSFLEAQPQLKGQLNQPPNLENEGRGGAFTSGGIIEMR